MLKLPNNDKALWDGFRGELRADYLDLMAETVGLPQRPRTETGMTAWADHALASLYGAAEYAAKRAKMAAIYKADDVAASWLASAERHRSVADRLRALSGL